MNWVSDLTWLDAQPYNASSGVGAIGVEFAGTAVSSPPPFGQNITQVNPKSPTASTPNNELTNPLPFRPQQTTPPPGSSAQTANSNGRTHTTGTSSTLFPVPSFPKNPRTKRKPKSRPKKRKADKNPSHRGYYELHITPTNISAHYFGIPSIVQRLPYEVSLANFTVQKDANHLQRPVGGGVVAAGALQMGRTVHSNISNDTSVPGGRYFETRLDTFGYGQDSVGGS